MTGYTDPNFGAYIVEAARDQRMNPVVRDMWATALESGDYRQGTGRLVTNGSDRDRRRFCCLGVLCDLAQKAGIIHHDMYRDDYRTITSDDVIIDIASSTLPEVVVRWAGLWTDDPEVDTAFGTHRLSYVNDTSPADFPRIARYIREQL